MSQPATGNVTWHRALAIDELPDGRVKTVALGTESICMTHHEGQYGALDNRCPHQGGPLGEGSIENGYLRCPWHGWDYCPLSILHEPGMGRERGALPDPHRGRRHAHAGDPLRRRGRPGRARCRRGFLHAWLHGCRGDDRRRGDRSSPVAVVHQARPLHHRRRRHRSGLQGPGGDHNAPAANLPLVRGSWADLRVVIDLGQDQQRVFYDGQPLLQKAWTSGVTPGGALDIAAVDLWANGSAHGVRYDDMRLDACVSDIDGNGQVDIDDLIIVILEWGCSGLCLGDVTLDGIVGVDDLVQVIIDFGPCDC